MDIKGHAAIVTGGGSGLGAATASELAKHGAKVALLDVNMDAANAHAQTIGGIAIKCDVSDSASAEAAIKEANAKNGVARILINCAGVGIAKRIVGRDGPQPLADYERVIRINLIGSFNTLRLFAADLSKSDPLEAGERGVAINTASVAAYDGQIGQAAYSSSKGGIVGLTLPAARELAQFGIRVCAIAPGIFLTPMLLGLVRGGAEEPRGVRAVPAAARQAGGIRLARAPHRREPLSQRRGDPPRRRAAHGAEVTA